VLGSREGWLNALQALPTNAKRRERQLKRISCSHCLIHLAEFDLAAPGDLELH
jgi:hypothetical protein